MLLFLACAGLVLLDELILPIIVYLIETYSKYSHVWPIERLKYY